MRGLSLIIGLLGVIALLTLGAGGAWAGGSAPMLCHDRAENAAPAAEMTAGMTHKMQTQGPAHAPTPAKAAMAMACCVVCVSPSLPAGPVAMAVVHPRPVQPARLDLPLGRSPSPEPGPPKTRL